MTELVRDTLEVPAVQHTILDAVAVTDVGTVRSLNEDSVAIAVPNEKSVKGTLMVLADGLGGHHAGEIASALVTSKLSEVYHRAPGMDHVADLVHAVTTSNTEVHAASLSSPDMQGMGTTVVAAVVVNQFVIFANVGDSRGYLFRDSSVIHRTKDHSLKDASLDAPGFTSRNRFSHVLTRAIGPKPTVMIDVTSHEIANGDVILLCSDGLTDCVSDEEIKGILFAYPCTEAAHMLVDTAKEKGGEDNISVIVAAVHEVVASNANQVHHSTLGKYFVR